MTVPSHNSPYDADVEVAVRAARRAADIIRDHAGHLDDVRAKGVNDFVTATDDAAQEAIIQVISEGAPGDDIIAEETDRSDYVRSPSGRRWIVDPLDGTTNFMQQVPPYAVSIALQEDGRLLVAVVLDVPHDKLFTAVAGHGLRRNGEEAGVSETDRFQDAFLATGFPYRHFEHTDAYVEVLASVIRNSRGVRRHGSAAVDLARLACGRFDGFFETGLDPWDVAAGMLLVREAGGRVTDYQNEAGLSPLFDRQVCATNGKVHRALLDHLGSMKDIRL